MKQGYIYTGQDIREDARIECDVCVVGSGSGGAVLAYELVRRGLRVVLLEEGGYHTRAEFDLTEPKAYANLYQELANRSTDDLSVGIFQGRCVGGGTTVNWCSTFRTPRRILDLWRDVHGVEGLSHEALEPHWNAIEERLHVEEWPLERVNRNNRILWDGLGKLGYHRGLIRRNVHRCANLGYCGLGCPIDAKQSMGVTYIPDAVEQGLTVYADASARILETQNRRVVGVRAQVLDPQTQLPKANLTVRANVTAVCCGALNSPALLLRSGLTGNGRVGRRTFLHPVVVMGAVFDEPVEAFYGAPQSVYSHQFIERGGGRLGFFLEVPPIHPLLAATNFGGFGPGHQKLMSQLDRIQACLALCVDGLLPEEEGGTVGLRSPEDGRLKFEYPLTQLHWEAFRVGCKEMARIQFAAGARKVVSLHAKPVVLNSERDIALLDHAPWEPLKVRVVTAHQMGGCAMGKDPRRSVVNSHLRYHGLDNLFVVDGSVLPTGLGVNPQETVFGIARWSAQHVAQAV